MVGKNSKISAPTCISQHTLPKKFLQTDNDNKISKSSGNVIDPFQLVDKYGIDHFGIFC